MTRINIGIKPQQLTDQHLIAEAREIKRITSLYLKTKNFNDIPDSFRLGTGHVRFFLDKGKYTYNRYLELTKEMDKRGINYTDFSSNWSVYKKEHWSDYSPSDAEIQKVVERIQDRLDTFKKPPRYLGATISKKVAKMLLQ